MSVKRYPLYANRSAMHNILNQSGLLKLEVLQSKWFIFGAAGGAIAIVVFVLALILLRRRRSKRGINIGLSDSEEPLDKWPEENFEFITERIIRVKKKYKSILFTSVGPASLPVTVPVNVAIGLAKNKKRCLLIDLDLRRDAIAKALDLDSNKEGLQPKTIRTEFENLWVWPGRNFTQLKQMNVKEIVEKASERFDFILLNAPSLLSSPDRRQIISAAQAAFICTKNSSEAARLAELIKPSDCVIIGNIQIPHSNLQQ